jgi:hypothetical protein
MIVVALDNESVCVGEFLSGTIHWTADDERVPFRISIAAVWHTEGESNRARGFGRGAEFPVAEGQRSATLPFRLLIPYEGPITFTGALVSVSWKVVVRVERRGIDEVAEAPIEVKPRVVKRPVTAEDVRA